jgi:signal transduction histidine kinase
MLDIGRLESGQMPLELGPLPVASLIEQVTERLSIQAQEKHVQIVHRIDPRVRWLFADADIIARVLQNLLDNALKYSASGDLISLEIQVKPEQQEPQLVTVSDEVTVLIPGDRVAHIVVRDQGPGIPPEAQDALFTRFSQARSKRSEGSGLGLFFCRLAVEAHRGVIWVESSPGQGSAFHFTLPLAEIYSDAG